MLADTLHVIDADAITVFENVIGQRRNDLVVALDRGASADAVGVGRGFRQMPSKFTVLRMATGCGLLGSGNRSGRCAV